MFHDTWKLYEIQFLCAGSFKSTRPHLPLSVSPEAPLTIAAELRGPDRGHLAHESKIFTFWLFSEKICHPRSRAPCYVFSVWSRLWTVVRERQCLACSWRIIVSMTRGQGLHPGFGEVVGGGEGQGWGQGHQVETIEAMKVKGQKEAQEAAKTTTHQSQPQSGLPNHLPDSCRCPLTIWNQMLRILNFMAVFGESCLCTAASEIPYWST